MNIQGINHITLSCVDLNISFNFYTKILGFTPLVKWDNGAYMLAGDDWFCLNLSEQITVNNTYTHYAFSIDKESFAGAVQQLTTAKVKIFKENISFEDSIYFLDPDGHKLELHVSSWQERLNYKKETPGSWKNITWYL